MAKSRKVSGHRRRAMRGGVNQAQMNAYYESQARQHEYERKLKAAPNMTPEQRNRLIKLRNIREDAEEARDKVYEKYYPNVEDLYRSLRATNKQHKEADEVFTKVEQDGFAKEGFTKDEIKELELLNASRKFKSKSNPQKYMNFELNKTRKEREAAKKWNNYYKNPPPTKGNTNKAVFPPTQTRKTCPPGQIPIPKPDGSVACMPEGANKPSIPKPAMQRPLMPKPATPKPAEDDYKEVNWRMYVSLSPKAKANAFEFKLKNSPHKELWKQAKEHASRVREGKSYNDTDFLVAMIDEYNRLLKEKYWKKVSANIQALPVSPAPAVTEAPLLEIPQSEILPAKPLKPGPNNSARPYIPMWNRVNRTRYALNENVNDYDILARLTKFSSPKIQKGKKSYFSKNQVKQEIARAKEEKSRKALEEIERAKKETEEELQEVEKAPNTKKNMSFKNQLKKKLANLTRKAKNYAGELVVKGLNLQFLGKMYPELYRNDTNRKLKNATRYRNMVRRLGYKNEYLGNIYKNLKSRGVENPLNHIQATRRANIADVLGIPYERLEELRKKTDITDYQLENLELKTLTKRFNSPLNKKEFVKKSFEAFEARKKAQEKAAAEEEAAYKRAGLTPGQAFQGAQVATGVAGLFF